MMPRSVLKPHAAAFLGAARRAATPRATGEAALDRRAFVGAAAVAFLAVLVGAPLPAWAGGNPASRFLSAVRPATTAGSPSSSSRLVPLAGFSPAG